MVVAPGKTLQRRESLIWGENGGVVRALRAAVNRDTNVRPIQIMKLGGIWGRRGMI